MARRSRILHAIAQAQTQAARAADQTPIIPYFNPGPLAVAEPLPVQQRYFPPERQHQCARLDEV